jgi:hypothetical protein
MYDADAGPLLPETREILEELPPHRSARPIGVAPRFG